MAHVRASITVECPFRAAHGAAIVRLAHVAPAARPRTHTQSAHEATCAPIYKYRRSPPCFGRAHTHPRARTCTHARTHARTCTQTHKRTHARVSTIAQRAQTHNSLSTRSRARAQIRTAHKCRWAHGRYHEGGTARTSAAESRLPTDRMRARTHASSLSYAIRRCCDAQVSGIACMAKLPITSSHICAPIYAQPDAHALMCIHR
jgi:hypothetical protein